MDMPSRAKRSARMEGLFLHYADDLRRFLRKHLKNSADIDDCAQDAFLNIWQRELRGGEIREDVRGYLFTTAMNIVRDKHRRERVRHAGDHVELSTHMEPLKSNEEETDFYWREAVRLMEGELQNLNPSTRKIFLMYYVEPLTIEEIASRLGISTRTVEREMVRALDHMKSSMTHVFDDLVGG